MEGLEGETPRGQTGVRDGEPRLLLDAVAEEKEVEVDRARRVAHARLADAPQLPFEGEEAAEQVDRLEVGLDGDRSVEEARLVFVADRIGLTERRDGDDLDPRLLIEALDGAADRSPPVAEVCPEPDVRPGQRLVRSTVAAVYSTGSPS